MAKFVKDLRNYFQHYKIPDFFSTVSYKENEPDFKIKLLLPTAELLNYSGWKSLAKQFMKDQGESIDLLVLIQDYKNLVEEFYIWFNKRQREIHEKDYDKVEEQEFYISLLVV